MESRECLSITDPSGERDATMESFMNIRIGGTPESLTLTVDWSYDYIGAIGEGHDNTDENVTFYGTWANAMMEATGPGRFELISFL